jgi:hypothetical protein
MKEMPHVTFGECDAPVSSDECDAFEISSDSSGREGCSGDGGETHGDGFGGAWKAVPWGPVCWMDGWMDGESVGLVVVSPSG